MRAPLAFNRSDEIIAAVNDLDAACLIKTYSSDFGSSDLGSSDLGRNFSTIACCASSIAFFWAVHCRSTRSVNAFRWCSICSLIALR